MDMQDELELAFSLASDYILLKSNPFRQLISKTTSDAYSGKRSVEGYLDFMGAIITDENEILQNHNIDTRMLFINSYKSKDANLEALLELKLEGEAGEKVETKKRNLIAMVKGAVDRSIFTVSDCKINFSSQLLEDAGLIPSKGMFDRRLVRLNTSMLYKQNKFNLFREDNVGYTALVNDLIVGSIDLPYDDYGQAPPTPLDRIDTFLETVSSHIGIFHLDPNRVLDVLLDFFIKELLRNFTFWIALFKRSKWVESTERGSPIMAHLLGYKFEYYQKYEMKNSPPELYYGCALLIKCGLVRLYDLLPYLHPFGTYMEAAKKDYMEHMNKEIKTNTGGLLAQFGALGEDGSTERLEKPKAKEEEEEEAKKDKYTVNDVVELTKALLAIGDIHHAELIFAKYDKLVDMYPEISHYIYRLGDEVLQGAYELYVPDDIKKRYTLFAQRAEESRLKSELGGSDKVTTMERVLVTNYMKEGTHDAIKNQCFSFFFEDWKEDLPKCNSYQDLMNVFAPVMRLAGYKMYLAPNLTQKLMLIVRSLLDRESEFPGSKPYCIAIVREFLLPAVSFSSSNPGTMAMLWDLLEILSFQERCSLYGEWGNDFYKRSIECKLLKARTERAAKSVMQRVSKNDVRQCGRDLGKLTNSNPMIIFNVMLDQIQSFDNMAPFMADACRYMGDFAYDVLGYLMTEKWTGFQGIGRMKKIKMKEDGINATWLRALSVFSGMLYKKQGIDPTPLLRYMIFRLHNDDGVEDLILFNEFVTKLCGIEIIGSAMTDDQIMAASCSDTVKAEAFQPVSADNRRASKRVINRLKETLQANKTALELIVLLYRLKESLSRQNDLSTHALGSKIDYVHQTIIQFVELLATIFDADEYATLIPDALTLSNDYKLPSSLVLQLVRPKTRQTLRSYQEPTGENSNNPDEPHPVFKPLIDQVPQIVTDENILNTITAEFYAIFWQLSLYDIYVPEASYQAAIKKHQDVIAACRDTRSTFYLNNRPSVVNKTERQAQASLDTLQEDLPRHRAHVEKVMKLLQASQPRWFPTTVDRLPLISNIIQHCLLPRSIVSETDAVFCAEFVLLMHRLCVRNFSSLTMLDKVLSENLPTALIAFTEYETTIHARFIYRIFAKMSEWHQQEQVYLTGAHGEGLIGFQKKWNVQSSSQEVAKEDLLSFQEFKRVTHKWHLKTSLAIEQALLSGEPHMIRNAFLILKQFIPHFPVIREHGQVLTKATNELANRERMDHLKVLARSYLGLLEKVKIRWKTKNKFLGIDEPEPEPPQRPERSSNSGANTPAKSSSPRRDDRHESSSERKRTREEPSSSQRSSDNNNNGGSKRVRHDDEDRPKRESSGSRHRSSQEVSSQPLAREGSQREASSRDTSAREAGRDSAERSSARESARDSQRESGRSSARDSPRVRDHVREAVREAARDTSRLTPKESSSRGGSNNNSQSRKRERTDEDRDRDRTDKRHREERNTREERRERGERSERNERERERERDRGRDRDREHDRDRERQRGRHSHSHRRR
ncbi:transcription factor/nuclear export subunit protein 2-domain-containing protein [Phascolomyces articulosus]|uniref:THO complex subunit 2 n=1 Tax=Phascolomyces articulosus TaxID=60185 RepID=A0AAD5PID8_9FUNG|nr:transcription factor/nuclear export subunit protein 2-domain-containing protein [Phascolomyces articulosus]